MDKLKTKRKKFLIIFVFLFIVCILGSVLSISSVNTSVPNTTYTIVIDAGHGGVDVKKEQWCF